MSQVNIFRRGCFEVELVASPLVINSLKDIPHQTVRYACPEIMALRTGLIYVRKNPEFTDRLHSKLLREARVEPEFVEALAKFYHSLGVPMTEAVKAAGYLPHWHLDEDGMVDMGELSAIGQRMYCKLLLGPLATVSAYRKRGSGQMRNHIGIFGRWSNGNGAGVWVMDAPRGAAHSALLAPGNVEQLNEELQSEFLARWPFFDGYALRDELPTFEIKTYAELKEEFPGLTLVSRDDIHEV